MSTKPSSNISTIARRTATNGWEVTIRLDRDDGSPPPQPEIVRGVTYIAAPGNMAFLGPANLDDMAAHIARSAGPSGSNIDYLFELAAALDDLGVEDQHVTELASRCKALVSSRGSARSIRISSQRPCSRS